MRHLSVIIAFLFLGGLLMTSQALAIEQYTQSEGLQVAALTGEQLKQFNRAQMTPQTYDQIQDQHLNMEQVREMHDLLNLRGYTISDRERDYIGPETREVFRSFQEDRGLTVTGKPNEETLRVLILSIPQHELFGIAPEFGGDDE